MDTQTNVTGTDTAHSQKSEAGGSDNVSSEQRKQQFIEQARARREAEAKPAKEQNAPAEEPDAQADAPAEETTPDADSAEQANETLPDKQETAPEQDDPVLSQFKLDPKAQYGINKALRRYADKAKHAIAERDALKKEAEAAKAQLAQIQQQALQQQQKPAETQAAPKPPTFDPHDPASTANTPEELSKLQADAQDMLLLYDRNRRDIDRAVENGQEKVTIAGKEYEVSVLESSRELALKVVTDSIPKRQRFLQEKVQYDQFARTVNPDAFDPNKPESVEARNFLQANQEIQASSKASLIAALVLKGKRAMEAEQKTATEASAKKAKPPVQTPPDLGESAAATSKTAERAGGTSALDKEIREAQRKYSESGSMADRTQLERLKARRKAAQ